MSVDIAMKFVNAIDNIRDKIGSTHSVSGIVNNISEFSIKGPDDLKETKDKLKEIKSILINVREKLEKSLTSTRECATEMNKNTRLLSELVTMRRSYDYGKMTTFIQSDYDAVCRYIECDIEFISDKVKDIDNLLDTLPDDTFTIIYDGPDDY